MGKLVRDTIPELIAASGRTPTVRVLEAGAYRAALCDKLDEEAAEVRAATTTAGLLEELADVLEVLTALAEHHDACLADIITWAASKRARRGGFSRRLWLEGTDPGG
ncbi:nucleoside triphosphate pyrophosphohydrolase [Mycolicibacillus parakoreensis]|uniref:Nucleoside triphosphate pyrophosphohydrolase n=1 Tax=Mycolicibacillus parakoreensis TaxID=1069221 RepID=A0ABY3TZC9_9MYCO|nr:nucleoside triphosphate pyrophosphohydrolase [Mycolicibacillus parakoreensis]MCV7316151.1 nucleoside triphosphate pyrophosphohydrolase [Mycolicibacillus parakoreensis]ULN52234.1 nucleoside triphosphate pyrophosphohydrolase [Mycolicibacillus parakoreensis]